MPAFGQQPQGDAIDLLGAIRRHILAMLALIIMALLAGVAFLAVTKPVYTAAAQIFIDPRSRKLVTEDVQSGMGADVALFESQVTIIGSEGILRRVIDKLDLASDPQFSTPRGSGLLSRLRATFNPQPPAPDAKSLALFSLERSVRVRRAQNTYVVNVEATSAEPRSAADIANAVAEAYLVDQAAAKADAARKANAMIDGRLFELKDQVRKAEVNVDSFRRANNIVTSEGGLLNEQQLTRLNTELVAVRTMVAATKAKLDELNAATRRGASPDSLPDALASNVIQRLREQYSTAARREAALATQLQPRHPVMVDARSQVEAMRGQINAELQRIAGAVRSENQIALNREREIMTTLQKSEVEVSRAATAQIKLRELEREAEAAREILRAFLSRSKETEEQQNLTIADARIITPASIPTRPSSPNPILVMAIAGATGLGLGLLRALAGAQRRGPTSPALPAPRGSTALTTAATPRPFRTRAFATIPRLAPAPRFLRRAAATAGEITDVVRAMGEQPRATDMEFRTAVTLLHEKIDISFPPRTQPKIVMLVSAAPGAGVTTTALALAYAAARGGDRTLLIDAASTDALLATIFVGEIRQDRPCILDSKEHLAEITAADAASGMALLPLALADLRTFNADQRRRIATGVRALAQDYDMVVIDGGQPLDDAGISAIGPLAAQVLLVGPEPVRPSEEHAIADALDVDPGVLRGQILTPPLARATRTAA
jgi:polysaccharide biosynthesis transport protein